VDWAVVIGGAVVIGLVVMGFIGLRSGRWEGAFRFTVIVVGIFVAGALAILVFDALWAQIGLWAAVGLLVVGLYLLKRWDDRQARRERRRLESGR
jgi:hypothetical protein